MNHSTDIAALAEALSKSQGEMCCAKKDSENPFYKSSYADLASVWDAIRAPFAKNGLAVIQTVERCEDGAIAVDTLLTHSSGQWVSGRVTGRPAKDDIQGAGACCTYLRRYSLSAIAGVSPEDLDGEDAVDHSAKSAPAKKPAPKKPDSPPVDQYDIDSKAIVAADSPVKLMEIAQRVHDSAAFDVPDQAALLAHANEKMMVFAEGTVQKVANAAKADSAAKYYGGLWLLRPEQKTQILQALVSVKEGLATAAA